MLVFKVSQSFYCSWLHATVLFVIIRRALLILAFLNVFKVVCGLKTNRSCHQPKGHNNSHTVQLHVAISQIAIFLFGVPLGGKPFPITCGTMCWRGLPWGLLASWIHFWGFKLLLILQGLVNGLYQRSLKTLTKSCL